MKATFVALFALAAGVLASPVADLNKRQLETQSTEIDSLFEKIQVYTGNLNKTIAAVPENPSPEEVEAATAAVAPDLEAITAALTASTETLSKRDFIVKARNGDFGSPDYLFWKVKLLVFEILFTVKILIIKLGLGGLLKYLTPLILSLSGLVKYLSKFLDVLLITVKEILDDVLGGVAAGLIGIIVW